MTEKQIIKKMNPEGAINLLEAIISCSIDDAVKCMYIADEYRKGERVEAYRLDNDIILEDYDQCIWHILSIYNFLHNAPYHLQPCVTSWNDFTKVIIKHCTGYVGENEHKNVSRETCEYLRGFYDRLFNIKTN